MLAEQQVLLHRKHDGTVLVEDYKTRLEYRERERGEKACGSGIVPATGAYNSGEQKETSRHQCLPCDRRVKNP
jgi:hypothetical protein